MIHFIAPSGDLILRFFGKRPFMVKLEKRNQALSKVFKPFLTNSWTFSQGNVEELWEQMTEKDRNLFPFNMENMDVPTYFESYVQGIRQYAFQQDPSSIPKARKLHRNLFWSDASLKISISVIVLFCLL